MTAREFIVQYRVWLLSVAGGLIIAATMRRMFGTVPPEVASDPRAVADYRRGYKYGVRSLGFLFFALLVVMLVAITWLRSGRHA